MTFFRSPFFRQFWLPSLLAVVVIGLIEICIQRAYKPGFWEKTGWMQHDPLRGESFDRLLVYEKFTQVLAAKPDIISVGDSSGLFSIQPLVVNRYLHGLKYASFSTGANEAFTGYMGIAQFAIENQPSIKYVVLNMYPNLMPSPRLFRTADLGPILYEDLVGMRAKLMPPSASLSPYAKSLVFTHTPYDPTVPASGHKVALEARYTFANTLGWLPEHDTPYIRTRQMVHAFRDREARAETMFGFFERSAIRESFSDMAELCRRHGVKLFIMLNPTPWNISFGPKNLEIVERDIMAFLKENPDVTFLTDKVITHWDQVKFGNNNHVSRTYVHQTSARMGEALEKAIFYPDTLPPFAPQKQRKFSIISDIEVLGAASAEQTSAALSYYFYTATGEKKYWRLLSSRVKALLASEKAFNWMMEDTLERTRFLEEQGVTLTYDPEKIVGDIVTAKGTFYCGKDKNVVWVRISGKLLVGLQGPQNSSSVVKWPKESALLIPLIKEGGHYRFDGYCPADSLPPEPAS